MKPTFTVIQGGGDPDAFVLPLLKNGLPSPERMRKDIVINWISSGCAAAVEALHKDQPERAKDVLAHVVTLINRQWPSMEKKK